MRLLVLLLAFGFTLALNTASRAQCPTAAAAVIEVCNDAGGSSTIRVYFMNGTPPTSYILYTTPDFQIASAPIGPAVINTSIPLPPGATAGVEFTNVPDGDYVVRANNPSYSCPPLNTNFLIVGGFGINVNSANALTSSILAIDPDCEPQTGPGNADGSINLTISGGSAPYAVSWTGPTSIPSGSSAGPVTANFLDGGSYTLTVVDADNCTYTRVIDVPISTAPDAGADQVVCNSTTATLQGNAAGPGEYGTWTTISGTGVATSPSDPNSPVTGLTIGGTTVFRWTIRDLANVCPGNGDDVSVQSDVSPTPAAAGTDQTLCASTTTLAANTPGVGTGQWSIVSGAGGTVAAPGSPTSQFDGLPGTVYTLRWTISNGACVPSTDDVVITFDAVPTPANAGPDQVLCTTTATLAANAPLTGTGQWTIISGTGGALGNPSSATSTFTGVAGNTYTLEWTTSNGTCPSTTDQVQIQFDAPPTTAAAGADQALCGVATTLTANSAAVGTGAWTILSGTGGAIADPANPVSGFTGTAGTTYVLQWAITNGVCPPSTDDVQIRFDASPTASAAGPDQVICGNAATLAASAPSTGTGAWTIVSGNGGSIAAPASPTSGFTGIAGETYVLRWTVTNGTCPPSADDVQLRFDLSPSSSLAGPDQALCTTTTALAANSPTVGTGAWTIISGTGGSVVTPSSPTSSFTGVAGETYVLRWTITNGVCPPSEDDVQVRIDATPTTALAGTDQVICGTSATMAANAPTTGAGAWSIVSGAGGSFADAANPTTTFTGTAGVTYVLRWTISNGTCAPSSDDVQIRFDQAPTTADAGADQALCALTTTLAGNAATVGTGVWSITSGTGGAIAAPANPASGFTGVAGETYVLRWTISNGTCAPSFDDVQIRIDETPSPALAGPDQALCNNTTTLAANAPTTGTGLWSIVSGAGGTVVTPGSPTSAFNGTAGTTYVLRWTVTNGTCTPSADDVTIRFDAPPSAAAAGSDQALCNITATTLSANSPTVGTGAWTILSGTGGTVAVPSNPASGFTGVIGQTYTLRWTISNGTCAPSEDDVIIRFDETPTASAAGVDQALCNVATTALAANTPTVGSGAWTIVSGAGGAVTDPADPASAFSGAVGTTYVLRWTISNGSCAPATDEVEIRFDAPPSPAVAGTDQALCATTTTLGATAPATGTGSWSVVSGTGGVIATPSDAASAFDGVAGQTYVLRWTISNGTCATTQDEVQITFDPAPDAAAAGPDQSVCGTSVTLAANTPAVGNGTWSIVSGAGGTVTTPNDPGSTFTGVAGTTYILEWTISSGTCPASSDQVQIVLDAAPTAADAGADQSVCGTTATLAANAPATGTGAWTIVSGTGGSFADATDPATTFSGTTGSTYVLRWTTSNGACTTTDDVQVIFEPIITAAAAGADKTVCGTTALEANTPAVGTGSWTIIAGAGGSIADPANPASAFNGAPGVAYTLRWTITSGSCTPSTDDVVITIDANSPTPADAGPDQAVCDTNTILSANSPTVGTGTWTVVSGTGGVFSDTASPTADFDGTAGTVYVLRWSISTGVAGCAPSIDDVTIAFDEAPSAPDAGPDINACGTSVALAAVPPAIGTGSWTILNGVGGSFADPSNPTTVFNGIAGSVYTLEWTVANACGTGPEEVIVTFDLAPSAAVAGADKTVCGTATLEGNVPAVGTGLWTIVSGTGGTLADATDPVTTFTGTAGTTYTLRWTITNGSCAPSEDDVEITFDPNTPSTADAGPDESVCGLSTTLAANSPAVGTGAWSIVSGAGGTLADAALATSAFSGVTGETYILRWTITSTCGTYDDDVQIVFNDPVTPAAAGPDKTVCGTTALEGNTAVIGTGAWTIVSGTGGMITDAADPVSSFTGVAGTAYVLRWTITNGSCPPSEDEVTITLDTNSPSVADAGTDQAVCGTSATLAANAPAVGTGSWSVVTGTGGNFADAADPGTTFTGVAGSSYTLRWTISSAVPGCTANSDEVVVSFDQAPTAPDAGADQAFCGTTVTLAANAATSGTGTWTVVTGAGGTFADAGDPVTSFTGTAGTTYTLRWTISSACDVMADDVSVTLDAAPTVAAAGTDKTVCGPTVLEGNTPSSGTGQWTIVSGAGGLLADATDPVSGFSGNGGVVYTLRWTITNATCPASTDEVDITFDPNTPTTANAGPDLAVCATNVALAANVPTSGTGSWSVVSGTGGSFADASDAATDFSGTAGTTYLLRWTISSGVPGCASSTDDVSVAFDIAPTAADAGADQDICGTAATLNANTPASGTGTWTVLSGTGGSFGDVNDPASTFTGTAGTTYSLQWAIANSCDNLVDAVTIRLNEAPAVANAGADQVLCGVFTTTLSANSPTVGTGTWAVVSGMGGAVISPSSPTSQFVGSAGTAYTLRWIVTNGSCVPSTDDVVLNFSASPAVTSPVTVCVNSGVAPLTAAAAGASGFNWYYYTDPSNPATRTFLANTTAGQYTPGAELDTTTPGSVTYEVTAVYGCGESPASTIVVNVSNTGSCGGGTGTCAEAKVTPVPTAATCTLSNGSISFTIDPPVPAVNTVGVIINIEGVSATNTGISRTNHNDPVFNGLPIGEYEYSVTYGVLTCVKTGTVTIDQSGTIGTPVASSVVAPVCAGTATGSLTIDVQGETGNLLEWSVDGIVWNSFVSGAPGGVTGVPAGPAPTFERLISVRRNSSDPCNAAVFVVMQDATAPIDFSITDRENISACFEEDGSFRVSGITGGTAPYDVRLLTGTTVVRDYENVTNGEHTFDGLPAGTYTVEIRDANGCVASNASSPVVLTAPGAVKFAVTVVAGASCESREGKSGLIHINFDPTEKSGIYKVGISTSSVIEPDAYADYVYNTGDLTPLAVDTLGRGNYFVYIKPSGSTSVCPTVLPTGFIDGPYMIDFEIQRVCNVTTDGSASINLVNVVGDPAASYNIEVFRVSNLADKVDDFSAPAVNNIIEIKYTVAGGQHNWLVQPDDYLIRLYQMNQGACPGNKPRQTPSHQLTFSVSTPVAMVIDNLQPSYPEPRQTGSFTLRTITGGIAFTDEDRPYYLVSVFDQSNGAEIVGPVKVKRNNQGAFRYEFRNLPVGNYQVVATDWLGCEASFLAIIELDSRLIIPNLFTPNDDNVNDLFEVVNLPSGKHRLVVTNRWGKEVYTSSDYREGTFWSGEGTPEGIYFYRLQVEGDKTYTGWVEILRGSKP